MGVALYPGSFDPFHLGHLDVVEEAVGIFGEVVVGVMVNPDKPASWLPADERAALIRALDLARFAGQTPLPDLEARVVALIRKVVAGPRRPR